MAFGLVALGSGGVAVFVTDVEAGPVALLAVGLILLIVGVGGRLPTRLKVGESEASWEAVESFATRVAEEAPSEQTPELVEAFGELAPAAPVVAAAGLKAISARSRYERFALDVLRDAVSEINRSATGPKGVIPLKLTYEPNVSGENRQYRFDAAITANSGASFLLVEIEIARALMRSLPPKIDVARDSGAVRLLIISNEQVSFGKVTGPWLPLEAVTTSTDEFLQPLWITSRDDLPKIIGAIREAFGIVT